MYTRWDSDKLNPETLAITFGRLPSIADDAASPPCDFEMFNSTGNDFTGTHYDPVWVNVQAEAAGSSAASSGDAMRVQGADDSQANADAVLPIRQNAWQSMMRVIRNPASTHRPAVWYGLGSAGCETAAVQPPAAPPSDQPRRRKQQETMDSRLGSCQARRTNTLLGRIT